QWEKRLTPLEARKLDRIGLLLRLPLDETKGHAVFTSEGVRRGTVRGKPSWGTGKAGGALDFAGNTHVEVTDAPPFDRYTPFSIGLWAYPTSKGPGALLSKLDDQAANRGYDIVLEEGKVAIHLIHRWPGNAIKVVTAQAVSLNTWHHVVMTYDGS